MQVFSAISDLSNYNNTLLKGYNIMYIRHVQNLRVPTHSVPYKLRYPGYETSTSVETKQSKFIYLIFTVPICQLTVLSKFKI